MAALVDAEHELPGFRSRRGRELRPGLARRSRTRIVGLVLGVLLLACVMLLSVAVGSRPIGVRMVVDALLDYDRTLDEHLIVHELRLPRTAVGLLAGIALGLAGAVMQGVARNPLADPGILGIDAGAALLVVVAISMLGVTNPLGYVWFSFAGAAAASIAIYAIGSLGRGGATPVKLSLAGAAITAFLSSVTATILLMDVATAETFRYWVVGSLAGRSWEVVVQMAPFIVFGAVMALASAPALNALAMGDDVARGLGLRVSRARLLCAIAVVLLCGTATAMAGPIAFVGLVVPHVARMLVGPDYRWILPYSVVLAPILLLGADIIGRIVIRPAELQVAVVVAIIGAPFFVWLVRRRDMAEL